MAFLELPVFNVPASYLELPLDVGSLDFEWTQADWSYADGARFPLTGREILLVMSLDEGANTLTVVSTVDPYNRTGDIVYSIDGGDCCIFPLFKKTGWTHTDGCMHIEPSSALMQFAVFRLPD